MSLLESLWPKTPGEADDTKIEAGKALNDLKRHPGYALLASKIETTLRENREALESVSRFVLPSGVAENYLYRSAALRELLEWIDQTIEEGAAELKHKIAQVSPQSERTGKK